MNDLANNRAYRIFSTLMVIVGVYALVRHGSQWAYEFGKWVGAN